MDYNEIYSKVISVDWKPNTRMVWFTNTGESSNRADIMKKSLENLQKSGNKSTGSIQHSNNQKPQINQQVSVPTVSSVPKSKADFVNSNFCETFCKP